MMQPQQQTSKDIGYQFYYDPNHPNSLVMLKNVEQMDYLQMYPADGKYVVLPNYYFLHNPKTALRQHRTIQAAIKQPTDRKIMVEQFCKLAKEYFYNSDEIDQFYEKYTHMQITDLNDILREYSKESFFYLLINRLLKGGRDPLQLYYGQYFMKMLHKAIKQEYENRNKQVFKCYRGAYFGQQQIAELRENIGNHISTLGFLSTSLQQSVAINFIKNAMIEIEVDDSDRYPAADYGYAFLDSCQKSESQNQKEVLFNAMCSFQVLDVGQKQYNGVKYSFVKLKYGVAYQILQKYKNNKLLSQVEQALIPSLLEIQYMQVGSQYIAISQYPHLVSYFIEWYDKYLQLLKKAPVTSYIDIMERQKIASTYRLLTYFYYKKIKDPTQRQIDFIKDYESQPINTFNYQGSLTKLFINLLSIMNKIGSHMYKQAKADLTSMQQQLINFQNNAVIQTMLSLGNEEYFLIVNMLKELLCLFSLSIKISEIETKQQKLEMERQIKRHKNRVGKQYGTNHSIYHFHLVLQQNCDQKVMKVQKDNFLETIKVIYQNEVSTDLSKWSKLKECIQPIFDSLKGGRYEQAIEQIRKCLMLIGKESAQKYDLQSFESYLKERLIKLPKVQTSSLLSQLEFCKASNINLLLSQFFGPLYSSQAFDYLENLTFKYSKQQLNNVLFTIEKSADYPASQFLIAFEYLVNKEKQKISSTNSFRICLYQCFKVGVLKRVGKYEEAAILKDCIYRNLKAANSTYLELIDEHFKKEEEEEKAWMKIK